MCTAQGVRCGGCFCFCLFYFVFVLLQDETELRKIFPKSEICRAFNTTGMLWALFSLKNVWPLGRDDKPASPAKHARAASTARESREQGDNQPVMANYLKEKKRRKRRRQILCCQDIDPYNWIRILCRSSLDIPLRIMLQYKQQNMSYFELNTVNRFTKWISNRLLYTHNYITWTVNYFPSLL